MSKPPEVIRPPNPLRSKLGGFGGIDADAIARAETALAAMSSQFEEWLQDEMVKLAAAQSDIHVQGITAQTTEFLYFRAHDLKGLGTTYGYPIVTRIAASLCRLLDDADSRVKVPLALLDQHVDGIRAAVRDKIQSDEHPTGRELVESLEAHVRDHQSHG